MYQSSRLLLALPKQKEQHYDIIKQIMTDNLYTAHPDLIDAMGKART